VCWIRALSRIKSKWDQDSIGSVNPDPGRLEWLILFERLVVFSEWLEASSTKELGCHEEIQSALYNWFSTFTGESVANKNLLQLATFH
jgi:hypothetical protein